VERGLGPTTPLSLLRKVPVVPIAAPTRPHLRWSPWLPVGPVPRHHRHRYHHFLGHPLLVVAFYTHELVLSQCRADSEEGMGRFW
jgi:hypothetical protein